MIKLTFKNANNSSDSFILKMPKVHIDNYDSTQSGSTTDHNNRVTLNENFISPYNQINIPSYDELPDYPTRFNVEYICKEIPYLKIRIAFIKLNNTQNKTGKDIIGSLWYFDFGYPNYSKSERISGGTTYPYNIMTADFNFPTQYGEIIIGYDDINRVIVAIGRKSFTVQGANGVEVFGQVGLDAAWGDAHVLSKGDSIAYGEGNIPSILKQTDVGKTFDYPLQISIGWYTGNENSLYDYLERGGVIPKYPDGDDDDDYPDGDDDNDSDPVHPKPDFPISVAQTGFVSMYAPSLSQLKELATFMWSTNFLDLLAKLQQDPYEAIISLKAVKCNFDIGGSSNIILGNVDTHISCPEITNQYQQIDCGSINLTRYYGNFLDFNPYTSIKIYLPFIGYKDLDVDEVMGSTLHLYYNVDLLTGSCVALLHINKTINGTKLNSVLYQFDGIIASEIPITATNYTQVVSSIMRGVATTAAAIGITSATGGAGAPASGALLGSAVASEASTAIGTTMVINSAIDTVSSKISVQHGGSLGGSMGGLATKQPYVIIQRVISKNPTNYAKLHGIPSNAYKKLSTLKGFTKMQDIQITSTIGTVDETEEIKQLLMSGVVF